MPLLQALYACGILKREVAVFESPRKKHKGPTAADVGAAKQALLQGELILSDDEAVAAEE